jgi:xanthine dehydrogenase accessory factor
MLGLAFTVVGELPVVVDMADDVVARMRPALVVDARQAGARLGTRREEADLVIGLGPGFAAGRDCHVVVETRLGPDLGQVFWEAEPLAEAEAPDMRAAGPVLLRAPADGTFAPVAAIGDDVQAGTILGTLDGRPLAAPMGGVLRGLLHAGVPAAAGQPVAEIDATIRPEDCFLISPAARAVAGGVLEAALAGLDLWRREEDGRLPDAEEPLPVIQTEPPARATGDRDRDDE